MNLTSSACALALFLLAPTLAAQTDSAAPDPRLVQPERPTIATHAGTVARGFVELEDGGEWDNVGTNERSFFAPTNLKIGLASDAQLNVLFNLAGCWVPRWSCSDIRARPERPAKKEARRFSSGQLFCFGNGWRSTPVSSRH